MARPSNMIIKTFRSEASGSVGGLITRSSGRLRSSDHKLWRLERLVHYIRWEFKPTHSPRQLFSTFSVSDPPEIWTIICIEAIHCSNVNNLWKIQRFFLARKCCLLQLNLVTAEFQKCESRQLCPLKSEFSLCQISTLQSSKFLTRLQTGCILGDIPY